MASSASFANHREASAGPAKKLAKAANTTTCAPSILLLLEEEGICETVCSFHPFEDLFRFNQTFSRLRQETSAATERRVCETFLMTTDLKEVAQNVVVGGWSTFVSFLMAVGAHLDQHYDPLQVTPPPVYRDLLAQQTLGRMDESPFVLLWDLRPEPFMDPDDWLLWNYQMVQKYAQEDPEYAEQYRHSPVFPSLELCFGYPGDFMTLSETGQLFLPGTRHRAFQDIPGGRIARYMLAASATHITAGGRRLEPSLRQLYAKKGKLPVLAARDGNDSYTSYWCLTLTEDNQPKVVTFERYQLEERPLRDTFSNIDDSHQNSIVSLFFGIPAGWGDGWRHKEVEPWELSFRAAFAKALKIAPFDRCQEDFPALANHIPPDQSHRNWGKTQMYGTTSCWSICLGWSDCKRPIEFSCTLCKWALLSQNRRCDKTPIFK